MGRAKQKWVVVAMGLFLACEDVGRMFEIYSPPALLIFFFF